MSDSSDLLSRFLDVEQFIKTDLQDSYGTPFTDASTSQAYPAGTTQWYGSHLANNLTPIQIIPYQQLLSSSVPPPIVGGYRPGHPEVPGNSGVTQLRYLYILNASTSPATKFAEEAITFLNQGQSYEIQLLCAENPAYVTSLRSVVRVSFNDRRLQFMEKEQLQQWKQGKHPTEKLIDIDIPLSYGVTSVKDESSSLNSAEFLWDGRHKSAVSVKLNCVSTEFTVKKCGGEKGIPLRIQIDTYGSPDGQPHSRLTRLLHSAYCLVKVFKPKGAERKLKNDLEWVNRLLPENKKYYRPSQEKTILTEILSEEFLRYQNKINSPIKQHQQQDTLIKNYLQNPVISTTDLHPAGLNLNSAELENGQPTANLKPSSHSSQNLKLTSNMTQSDVVQWMKSNQFDNYIDVLSKFTGADLLRLSRKDFIDICGVAEGVRFHNAVRNRPIRPKLSIFVCIQTTNQKNDLLSRNELRLECQGSLDSLAISPGNSFASSPSTTATSLTQDYPYDALSPALGSSFPSSLDGDGTFLQLPTPTKKRSMDPGEDGVGSPALKRTRNQFNVAAKSVYSLVTLDCLTRFHLIEQLACLCGLHHSQIFDIYLQNSKDIVVEVTNLVIENFEDESHFKLDLIPVDNVDAGVHSRCILLLKTVATSSSF